MNSLAQSSPLISVVMSVYNGADTVDRAIESILSQTEPNFEFIIINDGSQDGTLAVLQDFAQRDQRIQIISNNTNIGLPLSLNKGIQAAQGTYIARQDADDISHEKRFEIQLATFLKENIDLLSTTAIHFDTVFQGTFPEFSRKPDLTFLNKADLLRRNPLVHGSYMMLREAVVKVGCYDSDYHLAQDYDLVLRLAKQDARIAQLQLPLYAYHLQLFNTKIYQRYLLGQQIRGHTIPVYNRITPIYKLLSYLYQQSHYYRKKSLVTEHRLIKLMYKALGYALFPSLIVQQFSKRQKFLRKQISNN
ncbi:MAG: glycosyltransferase family 2 protein [Chloroflexota bacterium]